MYTDAMTGEPYELRGRVGEDMAPDFTAPVYDSEEQLHSRIPDFRHTLYWNPDITSATNTVSFYTSDMKGTYVATLQGINSKGECVQVQGKFVVR